MEQDGPPLLKSTDQPPQERGRIRSRTRSPSPYKVHEMNDAELDIYAREHTPESYLPMEDLPTQLSHGPLGNDAAFSSALWSTLPRPGPSPYKEQVLHPYDLDNFDHGTGYGSASMSFYSGPDTAEYRHTDLSGDTIRLVCLWPGTPNDVIYCSLKEKTLSDVTTSQLQYQALSYVWGKEPATHLILIQHADGRGMRRMSIRSNLHAALRTIRNKSEPVWLWIDSICINQQNLREKARQVSLMPEIYSHAWSVTIWLGGGDPPGKSLDLAIDFIPNILNLKLLDRMTEREDPDTETLQSFVRFAELLKLPWFQRRWVVQELVLARRAAVRYGSKIMSWHDFADATVLFLAKLDRIKTLYRNSPLSRYNPDAFQDVESSGAVALVEPGGNLLRRTSSGQVLDRVLTLEALLMKFHLFETSDLRDTIYSLLSLARDAPSGSDPGDKTDVEQLKWKLLTPRYDLNILDTHIHFVNYCICSTKSLDIICQPWAQVLKDVEMPSWIGQVTSSPFGPPSQLRVRINGDSLVGTPGRRWYDASKGVQTNACIDLEPVGSVSVVQNPSMPKSRSSVSSSVSDTQSSKDGAQSQNTAAAANVPSQPIRRAMPGCRNCRARKMQCDRLLPVCTPCQRSKTTSTCTYISPSVSRLKDKAGQHQGKTIGDIQQSHTVQLPASVYTGILCAKGIQLGIITEVSARVVDGTISDDCLAILGWKKGDDVTAISDRLWRTLCADRDPNGGSAPNWYKRACAYALTKTSAEGDLNTSKLIATESQPASCVEYLKNVQSMVWSRRFFTCDAETVGFGTRHIRSGDWVCILFGCSVPVILRPITGPGEVRLIGECFVYGCMNGEALIDDSAKRRAMDFKIR